MAWPVWSGAARVGGIAGLGMFACALLLAQHGQRGCILPYLALTSQSAELSGQALPVQALMGGLAAHEALAMLLGMLAGRYMRLALAHVPLLLLGSGVVMGLVDFALLAARVPRTNAVPTGSMLLPYLAFSGCMLLLLLRPLRAAPVLTRVAATTPRHGSTLERPLLQIVTTPHCFGCARAKDLALYVQERFPGVSVQVVDLDCFPPPLPAGVIAVPAYLLEGRLLFTGNPTLDTLDRALLSALAQDQHPS